MAVKKILTINRHEKLLRSKSEPVRKITKQVKQLAEDIRDTIMANPAVGLAAVQIGVLQRVFGARIGYYTPEGEVCEQPQQALPQIFINPEIVAVSEETVRDFDACMSIPGMMGYTQRAKSVTLRWLDEQGARHEETFSGWDARMLLHEYDHLEGVLFLDRLPLEDLYVYVRGEDGKTRPMPYLEVMREAEAKATPKLSGEA